MATPPKFTVVVHEPKDVPGKLVKANSVSRAVGTSTFYLTPSPTVIVFNTNIKNASDAEAGLGQTPPTFTTDQRDAFIVIVDANIESYRLACQVLVNAAPNETVAEQIAESFDMELKIHTGRGPRQDEILDGPIPNSARY
jgi:hypothetical protein